MTVVYLFWLALMGLPTLPSNLALERASNPFLRAGEPALLHSAAQFAGTHIDDAAESFTMQPNLLRRCGAGKMASKPKANAKKTKLARPLT